MTTSTASREPGSINTEIKAGFGHEFDLIDVIGFFWRWRQYLLAGALLGAVIGLSSSFIRKISQTDTLPKHVGYRWKVSYSISSSVEGSQMAPPTAILSFLNTQLGASTFYEEVNSRLGSPLFVIPEWVNRQLSGTGFIIAMEADKREIVVDVESTFPISDDDVGKALKDSLNRTIDTFNERFAQGMDSLRKESLALHLQIGESKMNALRYFDQNKSLSTEFKKVMIEGLTRELSQKWSVDTMVMLLGIDAAGGQTTTVIENYQNQLKKLETLRTMEQSLAKQSGTEDPSIISNLGDQKSITLVDSGNEPRLPPSFLARPWVGLAIGAGLGLLIAVTLVAMFSFYAANRDRLRKMLV